MKNAKIMIAVLVLLGIYLTGSLTFSQSLSSFKPLSEPDGFRGIKWGTDLSNLSDMFQIEIEANNEKVCTRKGDELRIGKAKLERIEYVFWMNKFYEVYIILRGTQNWNYFKETIFETFGKGVSLAEMGKIIGAEEQKEIENYYWSGRKTSMMLNYGRDKQLGDLLMGSLFIKEQKKVYEQQKRIEQEKKATERKARERGF